MKKIFIAPEAQVMDVTAESIIAISLNGGVTGSIETTDDPTDPNDFTLAGRESNGGSVWNEW